MYLSTSSSRYLNNFLSTLNRQCMALEVVDKHAIISSNKSHSSLGLFGLARSVINSNSYSCSTSIKVPLIARSISSVSQRTNTFANNNFNIQRSYSTVLNMTNRTSKVLKEQSTNYIETNHLKKIHTNQTNSQQSSNNGNHSVNRSLNETNYLLQSPNFRTMAGIQKLAMEPTREHIENIRHLLMKINAKDNNNQSITMVKDHETGIASVCIRSAAMNGISCKMMSDLLDIVDDLYSWQEGKGVFLYGHNNFFCSGGDLVSVKELANYEDGLKMATFMQYILARFQCLPMITMAFIQGKAIGGGAEVAVATDMRVMTKSARFGFVHSRVGIVAAWGGGARLVQLVGPSRAIEMMSSGRLITSAEALQYGVANEVIDDTDLSNEQVMALARKYLANRTFGAKSTIIAMKSLINAARTLPLENALVVEAQILSSTWGKPPHLEALNNNIKHRGE